MPFNQDQLLPDEFLGPDEFLSSLNGHYTFVYQGDGNLVLYKNYRDGSRKWLWDSQTDGRPVGRCIMQGDGNLVIYGPDGGYIWDTATDGHPDSRLVVQDDGNVVIYRLDNTPVWATNTVQPPLPPTGPTAQGDDIQPGEVLNPGQSISSANGRYTFVYQGDGNLVLYKNYRDGSRKWLWDSQTDGRRAEVCIMQGDGNLVIYDPDGGYIWDTATDGHPGSRLIVQDDGNVVIYRPDNTPVWATNTMQPPLPPTGPTAQGDDMQPGELLNPGQSISSTNGRYTFVYQGDGNLVLYKNYRDRNRKWLWDSQTDGRRAEVCIMQGDGNLVIYDPDGQPIWSSDTWHDPGSRLVVQDDGNVVIYRPDNTPVWATNTVQRIVPTGPTAQGDDMQPGEVLNPGQSISSANGRYTFVYQGDGNLVLYRNTDGRPLWASDTNGRPFDVCILQGDGNLVIYDGDANPIWSSGTWNDPGSRLVVQDDGNVVIYNPSNVRIWATDTAPPTISNFTPTSGQMGDTVTIKGDNLSRAKQVLFGNRDARFSVNSRTTITATVPANAVSGAITVITPVDSATSSDLFTVVPTPPPIITGFTPTKGRVGTGVTITGSNFSRATTVLFNGVNANFRIESDATITTTVPANATDGPITVTNRGGSATSGNNFDVETVQQPANLTFINTWMEPTEFPSPGSPFIVKFSFFNGGGTPTGRFTIRLQLDNGAAFLDVACPSYAPGAGDVVWWYFPYGLSAGEHFIYAYLDVFNEVSEVSEADNISYHGFRVG